MKSLYKAQLIDRPAFYVYAKVITEQNQLKRPESADLRD